MNRKLALLTVLAGLVLAACSGGGNGGSPPQLRQARAIRDVSSDGQGLLTTTVTVDFDRDFSIVDKQVPLASLFEFSAPDGANGSTRVLVQEATRAQSAPRSVVLKVSRLLPDGTTLKVAKKAFQAGAAGDLQIPVESDLSPAQVLLANVELGITRPALVAQAKVAEVTPADSDPAAMRAALDKAMQDRQAPAEVRAAARSRYDSIPEAIVPSPKARAALAALTGTFAEPAIDYLLTDKNCTGKPAALVAFQPPPDAPQLLARVTFQNDGRRVVSLNPVLEGERIEYLMSILAHESIHCDQVAGRYEEIAATAFDTFLFMNQLAIEPDLANGGTTLAKDLDVDVVAMINSGRRLPESIGVLPSPAVQQAVPNTNSRAQSFAELVAAAYPNIVSNQSPDEPLAQTYVSRLAQAAGMKEGSAFDLLYLDELLARAVSPQVLAGAITALGLQPTTG